MKLKVVIGWKRPEINEKEILNDVNNAAENL